MKKTIICIIIIYATLNSIAQIRLGGNFGVGLNNNILLDTEFGLSGNNFFTPAISYKIGINSYIPLNKRICISTELNFVNKAINFRTQKINYFIVENPICFDILFLRIMKFNIGIVNNFFVVNKNTTLNYYTTSVTNGLSILLNKDTEIKLQLNQELTSHISILEQKNFFQSAMLCFYYYFK